MSSKITRRDLIVSGGKALGAFSLSSALPSFLNKALAAAEREPHFFVLMYAEGGLHTPLGLDPIILQEVTTRKIDPITLDTGSMDIRAFYATYRDSDLINASNMVLGMAADPLVPHAKDIAIVNGVMLLPKSPFHDVSRDYTASGSANAQTPDIASQLSLELGNSPLGVVSNRNTGSGGVTSLFELTNAVNTNEYSTSLLSARTQLEDVQETTTESIKTYIGTADLAKKYNVLLAKYRAENPNDLTNAALAAGFNSRLMRFATLGLSPSVSTLDTHQDHAAGHPQAARSIFQQFANTLALFKSIKVEGVKDKSLFDCTTFMLVSDFSRSSWRQNGDGTDHNPLTNSILLAGKNILGGRKIGASTVLSPAAFNNEVFSKLQALPFDFSKGRALSVSDIVMDDEGLIMSFDGKAVNLGKFCSREEMKKAKPCIDFITPESVVYTVARAFGLDEGTRYTRNGKYIPGLVKA